MFRFLGGGAKTQAQGMPQAWTITANVTVSGTPQDMNNAFGPLVHAFTAIPVTFQLAKFRLTVQYGAMQWANELNQHDGNAMANEHEDRLELYQHLMQHDASMQLSASTNNTVSLRFGRPQKTIVFHLVSQQPQRRSSMLGMFRRQSAMPAAQVPTQLIQPQPQMVYFPVSTQYQQLAAQRHTRGFRY
jgi:hypothetical protein